MISHILDHSGVEYALLLHCINIPDLIIPFHWPILQIGTFFHAMIFLLPHDLIPYVMVCEIKQILHKLFYRENMTHYFPRY